MADSTNLQRLEALTASLDPVLGEPLEALAFVTALLDGTPDAILVVERTGRVVLVNHQAEVLFEYHRSELLQLTVEDLMPEQVRIGHVDERRKYARDPRARPMGVGRVVAIRTKAGAEVRVEISLAPVVLPRGVFTLVFARPDL